MICGTAGANQREACVSTAANHIAAAVTLVTLDGIVSPPESSPWPLLNARSILND